MDGYFPIITQDGRDGDEEPGYIANMQNGACAGFKYFRCRKVRKVSITVRGYCDGVFEVKTAWNGEALEKIPVQFTNVWTKYTAPVEIPDGDWPLYFRFSGHGCAQLLSFELECGNSSAS